MPRSRDLRGRGKERGYGDSRSAVRAFVPFEGTGQCGLHGTLTPESWNTRWHQPALGGDQKLRHAKVNFVSAGGFEPSKLLEPLLAPEVALADMSLRDGSEHIAVQNRIIRSRHIEQEHFGHKLEDITLKAPPDPEPAFIIDTRNRQSVVTGFPPPGVRSSSPTPSDSSEEVIVFAGRDQSRKGISRITQRKAGNSRDSVESKIKTIEDKIQIRKKSLAETVMNKSNRSHAGQGDADVGLHSLVRRKNGFQTPPSVQANLLISRSNSHHRNKTGTAHNNAIKSEEQALIEDYIRNIDPDTLDQTKYYNQRDLGGTDNDIWRETDFSASRSPSKKVKDKECGHEELCDFNDLSTSDGTVGSILAVLSKRLRKSGPQYLVVCDGEEIDRARWIATSNLTGSKAVKLIERFETEEKIVPEILDDAWRESDSSEYQPDADADVEISREDDDNDDLDEIDLKQRKIERMTDEKIAKLLSKQEQLDMGSSELILFDGSSEDGTEDIITRDTPQRNKSQGRVMQGARRRRAEFSAATVLADAYDGFDIMDFERSSLKKKKSKGTRSKLSFDISDSEFEASMQMALDNDRLKKKERRKEREELRALGLLGKKHSKPDLKAKFREGMGMNAVKDEIRNFLNSNESTLSLPPMDKADRKVVHEIANAFKLKSKSAGKGNKRFPILYRTPRTSTYHERVFDDVEARLTRRFLPRMDLNGKGYGGFSGKSGQRGFSHAAASYRDGDIVGGSAPELGVENKGRAMLEKMGWSSGTALGPLNNKGILQPVSHVVKTTKAGLG